MRQIPRPALWLGLAGLLPFVYGALAAWGAVPVATTDGTTGARILFDYGTVILSFMSGVLWGFATRAPQREAGWLYAASVVPALYVFLVVAPGHGFFPDTQDLTASALRGALLRLAAGFAGLLALDAVFAQRGLTPAWWMRLRVLLTVIVGLALLAGAYA